MNKPLLPSFSLGQTVVSAKAMKRLHPDDVAAALARHARCDWGNISAEVAERNEHSLREGLHVVSTYFDRNGTEFWIITEDDRSTTTVMLPEY